MTNPIPSCENSVFRIWKFLLFLFLFVVHTLRISEKDLFDESVIRGLLLLGFLACGSRRTIRCWQTGLNSLSGPVAL